MRTVSLHAEGAPTGRIPEITAEVAEQAEVVAVRTDDDWFALFADEDEKRLANAARLLSPGPATREEATETLAPAPAPSIALPELERLPSDAPAWLRDALVRWHFGHWRGIAFSAGIVLSAGVLVFAAWSLSGDVRPAPADITLASEPTEPSWTAATLPVAAVVPAPAHANAPRASAGTTDAPRPLNSATRSDAGDTSSGRAAIPPRPAKPLATTRATSTASVPRQPIASSTPVATPIPTPTAPLPQPPPSPKPVTDTVGSSAPPPAAPAPPNDSASIRSLLDLYRQAYATLDAVAVAGVWPSVNTRSLARAFSQLESQRFEFTDCRVDVSASRAQAVCTGRATFVPKVGGRTPRSESREWAFVLERLNDSWIISRAESR